MNSRRFRMGPGVLIILVHFVLVVVLLRYAGTPTLRDEARAADYITFALIPERSRPKPPSETNALLAPPAPPAPPALARRERSAPMRREEAAPSAVVQAPALPEPDVPEAQPRQEATPERRLDMQALRAMARSVEQERVPTAQERLRESEQMRSEDDSQLARGIKRAKRPDCQTAYAGGEKGNILLLIPLVIDTIRDKGCKW